MPQTPHVDKVIVADPTLFVDLPCAICGGQDFTEVRASRYPEGLTPADLRRLYRAASDQELLDPLVRCGSCELVQVRPLPNPELILSGYEAEPGDDFVTQNPFRIRTFKKALSELLGFVGLRGRSGVKILDIGCAGGAFPKAARDLGLDEHGLEPNRYMSEFARSEYGLKVQTGSDIASAFPGTQFDVITLWDVIEHLVSPLTSLGAIRARLKPDGYLVLNFPDLDTWPVRLMKQKWPFFLSVHLYYFTPKTMERLLRRAGFRVLRVKPHYQTLELGYVIQRAIKILPILKPFGFLARTALGRLPFTYYLGQTQVLAKVE